MSYYQGFDPCFIRERNEQIRREVQALRLEERLRGHRGSRGSRFVAFVRKGVVPLLRAVQLRGGNDPRREARLSKRST